MLIAQPFENEVHSFGMEGNAVNTVNPRATGRIKDEQLATPIPTVVLWDYFFVFCSGEITEILR